jgi:two-component system, NtrC family, nitrogen regulation sensor histidine kinase NtrY
MRCILGRFFLGRFEAKLIAAILFAALGTFFASLALVRVFVADAITVGFNDEVRDYLSDSLLLYPEFFKANKQLTDDQASRLAESPEVISVALEAEQFFSAPIEPSKEPIPSPQPAPEELQPTPEEGVLELVPASGPQSAPTETEPTPMTEEPPVRPPIVLGPLESLRASMALARALEEARRRIGISGEVRILNEQGVVMVRLPSLVPTPDPEKFRVRHVKRALWRSIGDAITIEVDFYLAVYYNEDFRRAEQKIYPVYKELEATIDEIKRTFFFIYLLALAPVLLTSITLGVVFARRITKRINALIQATQKVADGDLSTSVLVYGGDEISELSKSFNQMVSEVKEGRERVLYLERIGAWKEIARRLAHEIKNPLTPIRLAVQQVRSSYKGDDARFKKLVTEADEIVEEEIASLRNLVEEFSEFARLPDITPVPEDLTAFAQEFCEQNPQFSAHVALHFRAGPKLSILLDRRVVRRAILNLVKNAAEAIEEHAGKGDIYVTTSLDKRGRAVLRVEDTGPGIPEEMKEKIFEPYYTSKQTGTGLGLAIVKRTVFEHNGEIELSDREGGGAVFTLYFPLNEKSP